MKLSLPTCICLGACLVGTTEATQAADQPTLRTYLNPRCIVADEPFLLEDDDPALSSRSLFGAIIVQRLGSAIVQRVVNGGIGRISASAARRDTEYLVAEDVNLYVGDLAESPQLEFTPQLGCITIVAGQFAPDNTDCAKDYQPRALSAEMAARPEEEWTTERSDTSVANVLRRANVCLTAPAQAVYEIWINYSADRTAFRLESAGYWIDSLLTTNNARASRHLFYTVEFHEPSEGSGPNLLASAWVNVGPVAAGDVNTQVADVDRSEWVALPGLSGVATQAYDRDTATHQDVYNQIQALERSTERDRRSLESLQIGQSDARPEIQAMLQADITETEYRLVRGEALLEARRGEYAGLSQQDVEYMPVTVEIAVTESKSERLARSLLAQFLEYNSELITTAATNRLGISRSLNFGDEIPGPEAQAAARDAYYDAVAVRDTMPSDETEQELERAKANYNEVRARAGLEPIT